MSLLSHFRIRRSPKLAWIGFVALVLATVPPFLCLPLECDAVYFDAQARCVLNGGVLYRDLIEPNFPGVVWIHLLVRAIGGWSMVTLRVFDLMVLAAIAVLLNRWRVVGVQPSDGPLNTKTEQPKDWNLALAAAVAWFYLSLSPWNHCQRDLWMLLPALVALRLRTKAFHAANLAGSTHSTIADNKRCLLVGIAEGLAWSAAFWIKPHIAIPAVAVWTMSLFATEVLPCADRIERPFAANNQLLSDRPRNRRPVLVNFVGVLLGGLASGAAGSVWLIQTGAWPYFWQQQLEWNREYVASRDMGRIVSYLGSLFLSFGPWSWAHLVAIPLAIRAAVNVPWDRLPAGHSASHDRLEAYPTRLLAVLYLGWLVQSVALQFAFAYVHVPGVILALAVVAHTRWPAEWRAVPRAVAAAMLLAALVLSPATHWSRLKLWPTCVAQGPSLELRGKLLPKPAHFWSDYQAVVDFLREQHVQSRDVLVAHSSLMVLYHDLGLRPPTRFALPDVHAIVFSSQRAEMLREIDRLQSRFIVSDLLSTGLSADEVRNDDPATGLPRKLPAARRGEFPFDRPVLFRAGWFTVHGERG